MSFMRERSSNQSIQDNQPTEHITSFIHRQIVAELLLVDANKIVYSLFADTHSISVDRAPGYAKRL
jgi:hypothetical protein